MLPLNQALNEETLRVYAATHYMNTACLGADEFQRDLSIPNKISTQITRLLEGDPKGNVRILVNQIITFFNVFEHGAAVRLLFFLVRPECLSGLKTILVTLNRMRQDNYNDVPMCQGIADILARDM